MIRALARYFTRRHAAPVVVHTFKVAKTDLERAQEEKHRQLASELGRQWPPASILDRQLSDMGREGISRVRETW